MRKKNTIIKVMHIASGDLWAGAEVQLFTLAKALENIPEVDLEVVLLNHGRLEQELRSNGIKVSVIDEARFNGVEILFQLVRLLRKARSDLVHTHRLKENILGSMAAFVSGNIPSLRTVHGAPEHIPSWRQLPKRVIYWLDGFCGLFLQRRVIAVSEDLACILGKRFPARKISVIENGIDLKAAERDEKNAATSKQGVFKIGIAGRLVAVKRLDVFIKTARYLLEHYPEIKAEFYIYGDGPLRGELEQLSATLKTDEVVFFEGHCDTMVKKLQGLNALVMTSDHEGLPMILLEAMATQTPIIAHAVGGIPALLKDGECGYLVYGDDEAEYAEIIRQIVAAPDRQNLIVAKALSRVQQCYSSQLNAQKYLGQYRSVITRN